MLKKRITAGLLSGMLTATLLTPALAGAVDELHKQLFTNKCGKCHSPERIKQFHGNRKELLELIKRMSGKPGAAIDQEELEKLDEYILSLDLDTGSG